MNKFYFRKESKGVPVISRDKKYAGKTTGGTRVCGLEGCRGTRVGVRWSDGKLTYPCTADMEITPNGKAWFII